MSFRGSLVDGRGGSRARQRGRVFCSLAGSSQALRMTDAHAMPQVGELEQQARLFSCRTDRALHRNYMRVIEQGSANSACPGTLVALVERIEARSMTRCRRQADLLTL